jgi:hypothetical protein
MSTTKMFNIQNNSLEISGKLHLLAHDGLQGYGSNMLLKMINVAKEIGTVIGSVVQAVPTATKEIGEVIGSAAQPAPTSI